DISSAIQSYVESCGYGIVEEFTGHGVGRSMHEEPQIPNYGRAGTGPILRAGMTLAIEPMITMGSPEIFVGDDGWTVYTSDGKPSCHIEHTVLVTNGNPEILTIPMQNK
ncbi:MAG: M24 family metallopeptidase, partial [Opitutales bacterium]|nr:M24 family metallopeptidase [Opitutales bacterium]